MDRRWRALLRRGLALLLVGLTCLAPLPAAADTTRVDVITVRGAITSVPAGYVVRAIEQAEADAAHALVIRLDTPGGLDTSMRVIVQRMLQSTVPLVVYVAPQGARAGSAGVFVTLAAHVAAMAPGTNIGAAHPVGGGGQDIPGALGVKIENDAAAYIRSIAERRGRDPVWPEEAVRQSVSITAGEALEKGVIDLIARDLPDLLQQIDGRTVTMAGGERVLQTAGATTRVVDMTFGEQFLAFITDPSVAYILLLLGIWALVAEFYNPGGLLPGISGVILLILAFVAFGSLPVNWAGVGLIVFAIVLLVADFYVAGVALSVAGIIAFVLGSLMLFRPFDPAPFTPEVQVHPALIGLMTLILVVFVVVVIGAGLRARALPAFHSAARILNATGQATSLLAPHGTVVVLSEDWTAEAVDGPIQRGERVRVVSVEGLKLWVKRAG